MATDRTSILRENHDNDIAWDKWFRAIYPRVYFTLFGMTSGTKEKAEDLVQESIERFIKYDGLEKVQTDAEAVSYLIKTGKRLWIDQIRGEQESVPYADGRESETDDSQSLEKEMEIERLAEQLKEDDRNLVMWIREGRSIQELAERLRISYSAAGVRVHRLREKLRKLAEPM